MKLIKAHMIFTSRKYRMIMAGILAIYLIICLGIPQVIDADAKDAICTILLAFAGLIPLYGDICVFAGIHSRDGGQIAACQASCKGDRTILLGIIADRIYVYLWLLCIGIMQSFLGPQNTDVKATVWSFLTGLGLLCSVETISIMINRFFVTTQAHMIATVIESGIAGVITMFFWLVYPIGNGISACLTLAGAVALVYVETKLVQRFLKRSYYDE